MPMPASHQLIAADRYRVPRPFASFAVRSEERPHAATARAPYGRVHRLRTAFIDAGSLARLAAEGRSRVRLQAVGDIEHAITSAQDLATTAPRIADLTGQIAACLQLTGVLGPGPDGYRHSLDTRIDYLVSWGAGFHNDVRGHWSRCLFWVLALAVDDVAFVQPHAGVQLLLAPGDLIVFDPALAHGLCRPQDDGQAVDASFDTGGHDQQVFLTGELPLSDALWAAAGAPWVPVEEHEARGALDLMVAEFDERSGAIKRPGSLRDSMKRSTCHVDEPPSDEPTGC